MLTGLLAVGLFSSGCVMLYLIGDFPYRSCSIRERSVERI